MALPIDREPDKGLALSRMKWIATALLLFVTVVFVVCRIWERRYPGLAVISAFAEAAMVGALADWFAVVALFRHPVGIPIPHTAIIPKNKGRIADNLGAFIATNFLATDTILGRIRAFDPAARLARWLQKRDVADMAGAYAGKGVVFWLDAVEDDRVQRFLHDTIVAQLQSMDLARLSGDLLDALTQNGRHQRLLDRSLKLVSALMRRKETRRALAQLIGTDLNGMLRAINFNNFIGDYAARKVVVGAARFLKAVAEDEEHPLRRRFDRFVQDFIAKLKSDPEFRRRGEQIRDEILSRPEIADYFGELWLQLRTWLRADLQSADSNLRSHITAALLALGKRLSVDAGMQSWINEKIVALAGPLIEQYREKAGSFIAEQVRGWDERHMVRQLELNIGKDLQYIRINGTLVGGLVGLLIFGCTSLIRGW